MSCSFLLKINNRTFDHHEEIKEETVSFPNQYRINILLKYILLNLFIILVRCQNRRDYKTKKYNNNKNRAGNFMFCWQENQFLFPLLFRWHKPRNSSTTDGSPNGAKNLFLFLLWGAKERKKEIWWIVWCLAPVATVICLFDHSVNA